MVWLWGHIPDTEPEPEIDSDADGVVDSQDNCTDTPQGETVDVEGCSDAQLSGTVEGEDVENRETTSIPGFGIFISITAALGAAIIAIRHD
jgi:PGF-CTERM protein